MLTSMMLPFLSVTEIPRGKESKSTLYFVRLTFRDSCACSFASRNLMAVTPLARSLASSVSSPTSSSEKGSVSLEYIVIAPKTLFSDRRGKTMEDAYPLLMASSRHGLNRGSVSMFLQKLTFPVRMAIPVGPQPCSASAQVMFNRSIYPSSNPAYATGSTVLASSCWAYPIHTMAWPQSSAIILQTLCRYSDSSMVCMMAWLLLLMALRVRLSFFSCFSFVFLSVMSRIMIWMAGSPWKSIVPPTVSTSVMRPSRLTIFVSRNGALCSSLICIIRASIAARSS